MFLPPVSASAYVPPARAGGPRAVDAATPVREAGPRQAGPQLDSEQQRRLEQLRSRDRELRQHERAQVLLGGTLVRTLPSYTYERGPDGNFYAIDGLATLDMTGRGMLDPTLARRAESAAPATADGSPAYGNSIAVAPPAPQAAAAVDTATPLDDDFAAAVAHFYRATAGAGQRKPVIDLFA